MTVGMRLSRSGGDGDDDQECDYYKMLAQETPPGFVGADAKSLAKEAAVIAINRIFGNVLKDESIHLDPKDGKRAAKKSKCGLWVQCQILAYTPDK